MLVLLCVVVMASGCTNQNTKNFTASGMSFQYPDTWNATSQVGANATQIMVANNEFISSNGTKGNVVLMIKTSNVSTSNMTQTRQQIVNQAQQSGQNATNTTINITGVTASDISYTGNDTSGNAAYVRLIDFQKNNNLYVLLFVSGGGTDIIQAKSSFDVIVKSFKVD
jgi:hypothetical protein